MKLVVVSGTDAGTCLPIHSKMFLGRSDKCEIKALDAEVSRMHCSFLERDGQFLVQDLASLNGTFVNGKRVHAPTILEDGDTIRVGTTTYRVQQSGAEQATPATEPNQPPA